MSRHYQPSIISLFSFRWSIDRQTIKLGHSSKPFALVSDDVQFSVGLHSTMTKWILCLCLVSAVMAVPSDKTSSDVDVKDSVSPPPELLVAKQAIAVPKPALKIVPDTVVAETLKVFREHKSDETFVEVDAKSQSQAKSKSKAKSKAKAKMKSFFGSFFSSFSNSCDSSRRRRADEDPRKGDPDCSGTDCQRGLSRRRRSNDCQDVSVDSCFPASTQVETESRGAVEMKEVLLGERIKTAEGFSEVSCHL